MMQTALGFLKAGKAVWVAENASGSRRASDHAAAMRRLQQAGASLATHEMALFEWLESHDHAHFKEALNLIKPAR